MRYLLVIGGLVVGALAIFGVWLIIPKAAPPADPTVVARAAPTTTVAEAETDDFDVRGGGLRVCNQSSNPVSIALGYRSDKGWQSEGWWVAGVGDCAVVYQGNLTAVESRYFYLYVADDIGGGAWDGDNFMCTRDESFTIFDTGDCLARGYERTGFFEVDTQNKPGWTLQLKDPVNNDTTGPDTGDEEPLEGDMGPLEGDPPA